MEPEVSLPNSHVPATCPYPEPDQSSPCPYIPLPADPSKYFPPIFFVLCNDQQMYNYFTNHQLLHSSYMFRYYCVNRREFAVSALPSYTSMSTEVVSNTYSLKFTIISHKFYAAENSVFEIFKIVPFFYL